MRSVAFITFSERSRRGSERKAVLPCMHPPGLRAAVQQQLEIQGGRGGTDGQTDNGTEKRRDGCEVDAGTELGHPARGRQGLDVQHP